MIERTAHPAISAETLELADKLRHAVGNFVRMVRTKADTPTTAQSETLALLDRGGAMSIADIAAQRHVKHQSMRLVVAQLEADHLVSRMPNPHDGRSQLVVITDQGQTALAAARTERTLWIAKTLHSHFTPEERQTLQEAVIALERLVEACGS